MKTNNFPHLLQDFVNMGLGNIFNDDYETFKIKNHPKVNIAESAESYQIEMIAPGRNKSDFSILVENDLLTIAFTKKEAQTEENKKWVRKEFTLQSFKRTFTLSEQIDASKIEATYLDGILKIEIPKKEVAKTATLNIEVK